MFIFTEEQITKIHQILFNTEGVQELFNYILEEGYISSSSQGNDYSYLETFRHPDKELTVVFTKLTPDVKADHGHFSITVMDYVNFPDKYYGEDGATVLEQVRGRI